MSINKTITLTWDNKKYPIKITMEIIDLIEESINLAQMVRRFHSGDVRFTEVSKLLHVLLCQAGAKVTREEIFHGLFGAGEVTQEQVHDMVFAIFAVIFPSPKKKANTSSSRPKQKKVSKRT